MDLWTFPGRMIFCDLTIYLAGTVTLYLETSNLIFCNVTIYLVGTVPLYLETSNLIWYADSLGDSAAPLQLGSSKYAAYLQPIWSILIHRLNLETSIYIHRRFCSRATEGLRNLCSRCAAFLQHLNNGTISLGPALYRSCTCWDLR